MADESIDACEDDDDTSDTDTDNGDQPVTVCQDGTISHSAGSITFNNYFPAPCTITSCAVPGWPSPPQPNPVVPAAQGGVPGTLKVILIGATQNGSYPYTSNCCPLLTAPKIIVQ
jgi:hypothetical protein